MRQVSLPPRKPLWGCSRHKERPPLQLLAVQRTPFSKSSVFLIGDVRCQHARVSNHALDAVLIDQVEFLFGPDCVSLQPLDTFPPIRPVNRSDETHLRRVVLKDIAEVKYLEELAPRATVYLSQRQ